MNPTIRRAWGPDLPAVMECLQAFGASAPSREVLATAFNEMTDQGVRIYVCEVEREDGAKEVVGTASLLFLQKLIHGCLQVARIEEVAVKKEHQGKGYGKLLVNHCVGVAEATPGIYKVELTCTPELVSFYEGRGFRAAGVSMRLDLK